MDKNTIDAEIRRILRDARPSLPQTTRTQSNKFSLIKVAIISSFTTGCFIAFTFFALNLYEQFTSPNVKPASFENVLLDSECPADIPNQLRLAGLEVPTNQPFGKILGPAPYDMVQRHFKFTAITRNIPDGRHIVVAIDNEHLRLSWPKNWNVHPNVCFRTIIYEGGPIGDFTIGVYAVDEEHLKEIKQWAAHRSVGGMPILPERFRLDSILVSLPEI